MPSSRVLLMYISEVSGHHSATLAIEKAIRILNPDTQILNINAFNYTNPISEKIINRLYMGVIKKTPQVWDYLYDNPAVVKRVARIKETIHRLNSKKLKTLFTDFKPDVIVCTQAFPCGMVADYKKDYHSQIPLIAVLTDYIPHSFWLYDTVDYYVAPSEDVAERLKEKGMAPKKIKPLGIPIDPKFNEPADKNKIFHKLKLHPDVPTILLMGGGQGLGPMETIIKSLENLNTEIQEIVVTGTNKKLYKSLKKSLKKYRKKILLFGYTGNIHELMSIAKIIITKPGGVTTAEVLTKRVPMIIVQPIPGQEEKNTAYLTEKGASIRTEDPENIHLLIESLLKDPEKLNQMQNAISRISKPNASFDTAKLILAESAKANV